MVLGGFDSLHGLFGMIPDKMRQDVEEKEMKWCWAIKHENGWDHLEGGYSDKLMLLNEYVPESVEQHVYNELRIIWWRE